MKNIDFDKFIRDYVAINSKIIGHIDGTLVKALEQQGFGVSEDGELFQIQKKQTKFNIGDCVKHESEPNIIYQVKKIFDDGTYRIEPFSQKDIGKSITGATEDAMCLCSVQSSENKFKVGDWITDGVRTVQISSIDNWLYWASDRLIGSLGIVDNTYHLWSIQDAKPGDILTTLDYILIFKKLTKDNGGVSYCHYDFTASTPQFNWNEDNSWYFGKEAKVWPSTKMQRELLFSEMKKRGYTWNDKDLKLELEPKFHIGDWIISDDVDKKCSICRIDFINNCNRFYEYESNSGKRLRDSLKCVEQKYRLWTINDAKFGDVLANRYGHVFIFKEFAPGSRMSVLSYCYLNANGDFCEGNYEFYVPDIMPANRSQTEHLFEKMFECGYKWCADELKLEKRTNRNNALYELKSDGNYEKVPSIKVTGVLKKMIDEKTLERNSNTQKKEREDDDEKMFNAFLHKIEVCDLLSNKEVIWAKNKFKAFNSLSHWKPSDLQIEALESATANCAYSEYEDCLKDLIKELKKLM